MRASIAAYVQGQSSPDANFHVLLAGAQLSLPASAGHQVVDLFLSMFLFLFINDLAPYPIWLLDVFKKIDA
jgi:hypothetical protein